LCTPNEVHRANAIEDYQQQKLQWSALPTTAAPAAMPLPKMVTINISGGRKDKLRPGDILGALTGDAGFAGMQIGKIAIFDMQAFVAVDHAIAREAVQKLQSGKIKGRTFKVRLLGS
jgi:ATP-independent RNA helicase DbpA